jgi:hypothetical protein
MNKQQILDFTSAFPPAQKLTETLMEVDYKKHYNQFMDAVTIFCAFVAAVYTVLRTKWVEYDCTERCQIAALYVKETAIKLYNWVREVMIPFVIEIINDVRSFYNIVRVAQTV